MNILFQNALQKIPQKVPPIWFMRQAGRYHSHYQKLRSRNSFMDLCKKPELAAEVALGPVEDFDFDVSILFSDILFPLEAMGMGLQYTDHGPKLGFKLSEDTIDRLTEADKSIHHLAFQKQAVLATRALLPTNKSLIGFIGGPWTLFGYATEGSHKGGLTEAKRNIGLLNRFSEKLLPLLELNIQLQLDGGAEMVMIFDTAAGEVSPSCFKKWIQPMLMRLIHRFPKKLGYYSKSTMPIFFDTEFTEASWAGMGFDHRWRIQDCFSIYKDGFIQGNFDQSLLFLDSNQFKIEISEFLKPMVELSPDERTGWVCGLGHGVLPKTPENNVREFVNTVRKVLS